jgi:uncharacterized protein YjbI with pentapeptide repeats
MGRNMGRNEELASILEQHRKWLQSGRKSGSRADLSGARLDGIDFSGADLSGAMMHGASLQGADLSNAQLIHTDLSDADLQDACLTRANLLLTDFTAANLRGAKLVSTTPSRADQELGQTPRGPRFMDADLRNADLTAAYCYISDFSGASLSGAKLADAILERANFANNDLSELNISGANLNGANLQGSNLHRANLSRATMVHANLQEARLSDADVSGAAMQSANFADAKVDGIRYDRKARFQGIRVASCYGSSRFRRYAEDQDYIEEFKDAHPFYYALWLGSTDCGRSMTRVVLWSAFLAIAFGLIFYLLGEEAFDIAHRESMGWNPLTMMYYSVVTFTTLGFGDITPRTSVAAALVMVEVVTGYLMLGILISILATKVARRS